MSRLGATHFCRTVVQYERPYWLGPDGDEAEYFSLVEALDECGLEGIARWSMRKSSYLGALRFYQGYLLLVTLRFAKAVIDGGRLPAPQGRELSGKERDMANQLVAALSDDFRSSEYEDHYQEQVRELIETKRRGEKYDFETYEPTEDSDDLGDSLAASLQALRKR